MRDMSDADLPAVLVACRRCHKQVAEAQAAMTPDGMICDACNVANAAEGARHSFDVLVQRDKARSDMWNAVKFGLLGVVGLAAVVALRLRDGSVAPHFWVWPSVWTLGSVAFFVKTRRDYRALATLEDGR